MVTVQPVIDRPTQHHQQQQQQQLSTFRHSTHYFELLGFLRVLCQICGAAPVLTTARGRVWPRRLHYAWCALLLGCIYAFNLHYAQLIDPKMITIERAFYLSEFLSNSLIVTFITLGCYYYGGRFHSVPRKLLHIHKELRRHQQEGRNAPNLLGKLQRELLGLCVIAGSFFFGCFGIDLVYAKWDVWQWVLSSGAYNVPNVLISLNLGQYWLATRFMFLLYEQLNASLKTRLSSKVNAGDEVQLLEPNWMWYKREYINARRPQQSPYEILEHVRGLYSELDTLMAQLVDAFGIVLLLNFLGSFLDMSVEYFAIYKYFDRPDSKENAFVLFLYKMLWLVLHTGRIFFVLVPNNAIIREKCRTCFILNELEITSKDMEHGVNRFLLQLMVRKHAESACGIVDLDLLFLGGIASALANYIIFLIQIDLGNQSLLDGANGVNKTVAIS